MLEKEIYAFKSGFYMGHKENRCIIWPLQSFIPLYLHFSKTSLDEPLDVHLCSYFHEQHCVTRRDVIQT